MDDNYQKQKVDITALGYRSFSPSPAFYLDILQESIDINGQKSRYVLRSKIDETFVLLSEVEAFIWNLVKIDPDIKKIVYKYARTYKTLEFNTIEHIMHRWLEKRILLPRDSKLATDFRKKQKKTLWSYTSFLFDLQFSNKLLSQLFDIIANVLSKPLKNTWISVLIVLIGISGVISFLLYLSRESFQLIQTWYESESSLFLVTLWLGVISILLHELGHAIAMRLTGLKVFKVGFKLFLLIPFFYVDTNTAWSRNRADRIKISSGGIIMNAFIVGLTFLASMFVQNELILATLFTFAYLNLSLIFINLVPFIELDGYYILIDTIKVPNLIQESRKMVYKIFTGGRLNGAEFYMAIFGLLYFPTVGLFLFLTYRSISTLISLNL